MPINYSATSVCNRALDEIGFATIASMADNSAQAVACRRHYYDTQAELLERANWIFGRKRERLVAYGENDRSGIWTHAYAVPSDMAAPIRLLWPNDPAPGATAVLLPGQSLAVPSAAAEEPGTYYDLSGGTIYASVADAVLEYISDSPTFQNVTALFMKAHKLALAAELAMPLKKDRELKVSLLQEAKLALDEAIAINNNSRPQSYGRFTTEAEMVRAGLDPTVIGALPWDRRYS